MNDGSHFWIKLDRFENIIIDATLKQFDSGNNLDESIYIGEISGNEITNQYKQDYIGFKEWVYLYKIWCDPEIDINGRLREESHAKRLVLNNLINASILAYEIEELDPSHKYSVISSQLYNLYFNPILKRLKNKWRTDEILLKEGRLKAKEEFEFLLSKLD